MSADIITLPVIRVERKEAPRQAPIVLRLRERTAARLRSKAKDIRIEPDELAALLLDKILFPEDQV